MLSRRRFLSAVAVVPVLAAARPLSAASLVPRELKFLHTHTGEKLAVQYFSGGGYLTDALETVNHFLRDFRTGEVHAIDPSLLDLLHRLNVATESKRPFEVISGYRSPLTNAMLNKRSEGVAAHSLHMDGQAIDIRLTDVPLKSLHESALSLRRGGVGYYPSSNFVHVDTGRVRYW